ncbi:MAG TPA: DNA-3-methyladenine glycosylase [Ktedonobacteraceae bacterium]
MEDSFATVVATATAYLSEADPVMQATIARVGPCTLQPDPDVFSALVDAIISQQISVKAADAIMARVRSALPDGKVTPESLLPLDVEYLRALGLSNSKARYIRNIIEHIDAGKLQLERLNDLEDEEIITRLSAIKGIGRWTAEMSLIFTFARPDVLPVDDLGLLEGMRSAYQLPERPTRQQARERAEPWRPYRTFATWYLWGLRRIETRDNREKTRIVSL